MSKKDFQPIENDYQFFMDSATEAEQDLAEHLRELTRIEASDRPLSILDFGCGEGEFTESLLAAFQREPQQLHLALLEPVSTHRQRARERLASYCVTPPAEFSLLQDLQTETFDVILANHSGYYVESATEVATGFARRLNPSGLAILAIAGFENFLLQLWRVGFESIGRNVPYWTAEDYVTELTQHDIPFRSKQVPYQLRFADSSENRDKILRFLFGDFWSAMDHALLRSQFQEFAIDGDILIDTSSRHLVIEA